jgi:hypothetical protein
MVLMYVILYLYRSGTLKPIRWDFVLHTYEIVPISVVYLYRMDKSFARCEK